MIEASDQTPLAAAVREAREEIGLRLPTNWTVRALTPVQVLSTGVLIEPYWVEVATSPRLKPAAEEVEAILRVPLAELGAPGVLRPIPHPRREGEQVMAYVWRGHTIWGATAQTIAELLRKTDIAPGSSIISTSRSRGRAL
jgi:8-oxo-dGTP pyrophosphatase MutT (NUDIX family)